MNCADLEEKLNALHDGELAGEERAAVETHLASCEGCRRTLEALRAQDRDLAGAFGPERERVERAAFRAAAPPVPVARFAVPLAAAAGFLLAMLLFRRGPDPRIERLERRVAEIQRRHERELARARERGLAHLDVSTGAVEVREEGGDWSPLATGGAIRAGAQVRTVGKAKGSFLCDDGSEVRLNAGTEVRFAAARRFELARGQIYTRVAPGREAFEVRTDQTSIEALGTTLDISHAAAVTTLRVLDGAARMGSRTVKSGFECRWVEGKSEEPRPARDLAMLTRWVHEILVLKGRDSAELEKRVNDMLATLGRTKMEELYEYEIRAMGDHCALPLTRYIQSAPSRADPERRRKAARILADIAGAASVPDFVDLLGDGDAEVRACAARGLRRITGETLGFDEAYWRKDSCEEGRKRWEEWLKQHPEPWGAGRK